MKRILIVLSVLLLVGAAACSKKGTMDADVAASRTEMLKIAGNVVYSADENTTQLSQENNTFRVGNDDMSAYFSVACRALPESVGQQLTADLTWKQNGTAQARPGVSFTVQKMEGDLVWLWAPSEKIGAVIRSL